MKQNFSTKKGFFLKIFNYYVEIIKIIIYNKNVNKIKQQGIQYKQSNKYFFTA
jgi:hypothetical protein